MPPPQPRRRRQTEADAEALAELREAPAIGGLRKAPKTDPVLTVAGNAPTEDTRTARRGGRQAPTGRSERPKVSFYVDPADAARMRAAFDWTRGPERHTSLSDFIANAVAKEVARLEQQYNNGKPWPDLGPGQIPTGRPIGT